MDDISSLYKYLPAGIARAVCALPKSIKLRASEIRLRADAPASVTCAGANYFFDKSGVPCLRENALTVSRGDISEAVALITGNSLYAYDECIKNGYIPLREGGRAGVCGIANVSSGSIKNFAEIKYINLRVYRFIKDFASPLVNEYAANGVRGAIIISPPAMGKTTFLRSALYLISNGIGIMPRRVGVADERAEIACGVPLGIADVVTSLPKAQAVSMLTRTMSPELIICDEISETEADAVAETLSGGVNILASAHADNIKSLCKRRSFERILASGAFPLCVRLFYNGGYGLEISETEGCF